jgi:alpha-galactosidase
VIRPTRHTSVTWLIAIGAALVATLALASPASARPLSPTLQATTAAAPATNADPVAATPPMGWNDWYTFFCDVNEQLVEQTADAMVSSGMRDAGYRYVNLDDCWAASARDANGHLQADPKKFPHGMKAVADYVHARGLKLGIYEDVGTKTCAGYPGSYGHVQDDADTFASWEIDFVKVDWCNVPFGDFPGLSQQQVAVKLYTAYSQALKATGRPMFFSICEWDPKLKPWTWAPAISNMWRTNNDYGSQWSQTLANLDQEAPLARYAGPGHWNDPDILMVGKMASDAESQAHFSAWAMLAAPLLAGNDLRNMSAATKAILTNREVIAIDQDRAGRQGDRVHAEGPLEVWAKPLSGGARAVGLFNLSDQPSYVEVKFAEVGLKGPAKTRDVWAAKDLGKLSGYRTLVPGHGVVLLRVG